jgi:nucleoside-diphosphate-sugar epimerase
LVGTEDDTLKWHRSDGQYVLSRLRAEDMVLRYATEHELPAVAMCVSTTYGSGDWGQTPHGAIVAGAAFGKVPFVMDGIQLEVVGVDDAARAMILAAEHGRNGERYIVSEKLMANKDIVRIAAEEAGVPPPRRSVPVPALYGMAALGSLKSRLRGTDERLTLESVRLMRAEGELDHGKATRELGWHPEPVEDSIRAAARFWIELRAAMRKARTDRGTSSKGQERSDRGDIKGGTIGA